MTQCTVRPSTVAEISSAPNFAALLDEYCAESGITELGRANAQLATYNAMEELGVLKTVAAYVGDELQGFVCVLVHTLPHFGCRVGISESLFVAEAARHTGAGVALMQAAESAAMEHQAEGFLLSAPVASRLAKIAPAIGYRPTNITFFKSLCPKH